MKLVDDALKNIEEVLSKKPMDKVQPLIKKPREEAKNALLELINTVEFASTKDEHAKIVLMNRVVQVSADICKAMRAGVSID